MVVIRLSRAGAKKRPFYHICVSDRRNKRDGSFIEKLGFYNPIAKETEEKIKFDKERYDYWVSVGAQPSDTVMMLLKRSQMTDEEIAKLEQKKIDAKQKRKEQEILKKQEEAKAAEAEEAPAEEAPAEEAPAEEAPAEEAPAEEAPAEEAPAEEAPAEEAPAEEAPAEEAPAEEAPAEEAPAEEAPAEEAPAEEAPAEEAKKHQLKKHQLKKHQLKKLLLKKLLLKKHLLKKHQLKKHLLKKHLLKKHQPKKLLLKKHLLKKHQLKKHLLKKHLLKKLLPKKLNQKKRKISNINNIPVAKFGKTHGLKGEIKVISYCDPLENILTFSNFFLEDKSPLKIRFVSTSKSFIAKIESIDSIEDAKAFVNKEIFVPIEEIRQDDDAIYWNDLIGCDVIDQNSKLLGKIYKLENHGASDLIFIQTNQEDIIIPLEDQFLGKFDIEANVLNVNWE